MEENHFYNINGKVYFGEMTFFHFSRWEKFEPYKFDEIFGSWLKIPNYNEPINPDTNTEPLNLSKKLTSKKKRL